MEDGGQWGNGGVTQFDKENIFVSTKSEVEYKVGVTTGDIKMGV